MTTESRLDAQNAVFTGLSQRTAHEVATSTNNYAEVASSSLDFIGASSYAFVAKNLGTNTVNVRVVGWNRNGSNVSDRIVISEDAAVAGGVVVSYADAARYTDYAVEIQSAVSDNHTNVVVHSHRK